MKRILISVAAVLAVGAPAFGLIANTPHDLSSNDTGSRICVFCHFPHDANPAVPLWNHTLGTSTNYTQYTSPTLNHTGSSLVNGQAGTISALCMSCHDGTVGLGSVLHTGSFGTITDPGTMGAVTANLGTDLSNDHPVGITYDTALTGDDGELVAPGSVTLQLFGGGSNQVECATCHDVHNTPNISPFLVIANTSSAICTNCHIK